MKFAALALSGLLTIAPVTARADTLVFAAASLKEPLDQIAKEFGDVVVSYGGSGTLARQISLGAPADVVLLANAAWMDVLADQGAVDQGSIADFASNRLVLAGQEGAKPVALTPDSFAAALGDGRLAIGLTKAVPAGIYGKAALQSAGLWDIAEGRLAEVDNVRAAVALVARGQTPLGVVYATDLRVSEDVGEVASFPPDSHPPIRYVGAMVDAESADGAAFWAYLRSAQGQAILAGSGFLPPQDLLP
ncbi:MAG: molybdate ABC transporter substrate-binding protein [Yoonia sp.]|uniref:molybdate ABC transporter substrate-binding protein n=1 Tax=Yoonia sp. TaxID=2212373 RepID=UPI003EFAFF35